MMINRHFVQNRCFIIVQNIEIQFFHKKFTVCA